jgi:hypothetical protein
VLLAPHGGERTLTHLSLTAGADLDLRRVELLSLVSREAHDAARRAAEPVTSQWGDLARLWGEHDPELRRDLPLLRTVHDHADARQPAFAMAVDPQTDETWDRGWARAAAAVRLVRDEDAGAVRVGDWVLTEDGGRRRVERVADRDVHFAGAALPPPPSGAERILLHPARMSKLDVVAGETRRLEFEPLARPSSARGQYLVLRLAAHALRPGQTVTLDYGLGGENLGRFVFATAADGAVRTYALRVTTQPNWALRPKDWITLQPSLGTIRLESARIVEALE